MPLRDAGGVVLISAGLRARTQQGPSPALPLWCFPLVFDRKMRSPRRRALMAVFTSADLLGVLRHPCSAMAIAGAALDILIFRFLSEVALFWLMLRHTIQMH